MMITTLTNNQIVNANSSSSMAASTMHQQPQHQDTRTHVVGELYDTERSYVESLQILVDKYMKPLKSQESHRQLIDSQLVDEIFYTIPEILEHHEAFLASLQHRLSSDWDSSQVIGDVFIDAFANQQIIDTYTAFMNNWKSARQAIKLATQTKPAFERYLEAMSRGHRNKLTLDALLIMPVQRIPRYELLIKELIKHTPEEHADYALLLQAQREIHQLALKIDRAEREMMHQEQLRELESLIEGHVELQHPQRDFLRYDLVTIQPTSAGSCSGSTTTNSTTTSNTSSNNQQLSAAACTQATSILADTCLATSSAPLCAQSGSTASTAAASSAIALATSGPGTKMKERVLFLFCDLLIMTSVKKKASRRFGANLQAALADSCNDLSLLEGNKFKLLLRVPLDQIEVRLTSAQYQHQREQLQLKVQHQFRQLRERQRELESDLAVVQQIGALAQSKLCTCPEEQALIGGAISESISRLRERLADLSRQIDALMNSSGNQMLRTDFYPMANAATQTSSQVQQANEQVPSTSLEFIISTSPPTSDQSAGEQDSMAGFTCESQVVTFASLDRLQAFLHTFTEAKQQRYQLQMQRQQQHQQKMYSTTAVLKMSQPGTPEHGCGQPKRVQTVPSNDSGRGTSSSRVSSVPLGCGIQTAIKQQQPSAPQQSIVHQMSAPQSLAMSLCTLTECPAASKQTKQHAPCSSSAPRANHQLMHQPKSQPASLDTYYTQTTSLAAEHKPVDFAERNRLLPTAKVAAPKFVLATPMRLLNTQHPALQFTCSSLKSQTVRDRESTNHLWLCMSNGYVSHVALILLAGNGRKKPCSASNELNNDDDQSSGINHKQATGGISYRLADPIIQSAGDICKSHINCVSQVSWIRRKRLARVDASRATTEVAGEQRQREDLKPTVASPPVDIGSRSANPPCRFLSESAPTPSRSQSAMDGTGANAAISTDAKGCRGSPAAGNSASTTRLEVPARKVQNPRHQHLANLGQRDPSTVCHHLHPKSPLAPKHRHCAVATTGAPLGAGRNHHHHHHHHNHQHSHGHHHLYSGRHHTVPLGELHRALDPAPPVATDTGATNDLRQAALPPTNSSAGIARRRVSRSHQQLISDCHLQQQQQQQQQLKQKQNLNLKGRSMTPPAGGLFGTAKSSRSARSLRHQASLKTSSILAKLVGSAGKKSSSYLRRATASAKKNSPLPLGKSARNLSDLELDKSGNDSDTSDNGAARTDLNLATITTPGSAKCHHLDASQPDLNNNNNQVIVSPLSSVSSLASTNSSMTVNSVCVSSPNHSSCDLLLAHSLSASCCSPQPPASSAHQDDNANSNGTSPIHRHRRHLRLGAECRAGECAFRSRSATVPSRDFHHQRPSLAADQAEPNHEPDNHQNAAQQTSDRWMHSPAGDASYRVSEIVADETTAVEMPSKCQTDQRPAEERSALWLGCDDGSLLVIDCLANRQTCNLCTSNHQVPHDLDCNNKHSEIKLGAAICDIRPYKDHAVFLALANGQLAIITRSVDDEEAECDGWMLGNPKILTISPAAGNGLSGSSSAVSKLCIIDRHLWYSHGRHVYVLKIDTLELESSILVSANDLQFTTQSISSIDNMEPMHNLSCVCISLKSSHVIKLYDCQRHSLLLEVNLFDPINRMLSYGNDIIRQHKTASIKVTSLLSAASFSTSDKVNSSTLFVATSAGIVLYLSFNERQLDRLRESPVEEWRPQIASLRHGHSGGVKFLHLMEVSGETGDEQLASCGDSKRTFLISGGAGLDLYGPVSSEQQQAVPLQLNSEEDNLNHLILWQL